MNWLQDIGKWLFQVSSLLLVILLLAGSLVFINTKIRSWLFLYTPLYGAACDVLAFSITTLFVGLIGSVMFFVGGFL